jgi:hypothetical protein
MCGHGQPSRNIDPAQLDITTPEGICAAY